MSTSLKKRIFDAILFAVLNFLVLLVVSKYGLQRKDWFIYSLIWSVAWAIGLFVDKNMDYWKKRKGYELVIKITNGVILFILGTFIIIIVIGSDPWKETFKSIFFPFLAGNFVSRILKTKK